MILFNKQFSPLNQISAIIYDFPIPKHIPVNIQISIGSKFLVHTLIAEIHHILWNVKIELTKQLGFQITYMNDIIGRVQNKISMNKTFN